MVILLWFDTKINGQSSKNRVSNIVFETSNFLPNYLKLHYSWNISLSVLIKGGRNIFSLALWILQALQLAAMGWFCYVNGYTSK